MTTLFVLLLALAVAFLAVVIVKTTNGTKPDGTKHRVKK